MACQGRRNKVGLEIRKGSTVHIHIEHDQKIIFSFSILRRLFFNFLCECGRMQTRLFGLNQRLFKRKAQKGKAQSPARKNQSNYSTILVPGTVRIPRTGTYWYEYL